jgi:hypothetical protein
MLIAMANPKDKELFNQISSEIALLEQHQIEIRSYLAGHDYDLLTVLGTLQVFRDTLNKLTAQILTLYELKGQRTKITWEQLLRNIDNALENMRNSPHPNPRVAIELALNMSEPSAREVMNYLSKLKQSLK